MSTATKQQERQAATGGGELDRLLGKTVKYRPFGESEDIELSFGQVKSYISAKTRNGNVATDADIIKFMMLCKARELNPWVGDAYLVGYDSKDGPTFSLITSIQALFKRAEANPHFDGIQSGVIVTGPDGKIVEREGDLVLPNEKLIGGWAKVYRKDRSQAFYDALNLSTYDKGRSQWEKDKSGMIVKCFDDQTEVLTTRGFELFSQVRGKVLQVDNGVLTPTDSTPFCQPYSGDMIRYDNQNLDLCVTPNHDMILNVGKLDAESMYREARLRPKFHVPRTIPGSELDNHEFDDDCLRLCAAFLCDGWCAGSSFMVSVSRKRKIEALERVARHVARRTLKCVGDVAVGKSGRAIVTRSDKEQFRYRLDSLCGFVREDKTVNTKAMLSLSRRQARVFVDAMVFFDGNVAAESGVRRFYGSRPALMEAMEVASVLAGLSCSPRSERVSDISTGTNYAITLSKDDYIPIRRQTCDPRMPSLERVQNASGVVWCVTVPSGVIVVRRQGFSFVCGNCAEASALRKAFPSQLSGLYVSQEQGLIAAANTASAPVHKPQPKTLSDLAQTLRQKPTTQAEQQPEDESTPDLSMLQRYEIAVKHAATEADARDLYEAACNPDNGYLTSEDDVRAAGEMLTARINQLKGSN